MSYPHSSSLLGTRQIGDERYSQDQNNQTHRRELFMQCLILDTEISCLGPAGLHTSNFFTYTLGIATG